jgi:hypothetical protein
MEGGFVMNKELLFENLYNLYDLSSHARTLEGEKRILKNINSIVNIFGLKKEFTRYLSNRLYEEGIFPGVSKITSLEIAEGTEHIEIWIGTDILNIIFGSAYLVDIEKNALLINNKIVKQDEPFIYANPNEPVLFMELEFIEEILSNIDRELFIQAKTSHPCPPTFMGVDVEFRYTEEFIENMRRGC